METIDIDAVDKQILSLLNENARQTDDEIAAGLDISTAEVTKRIERLEETGVITSFSSMLDTAKIGYISVAFGFSVEPGKTDDIAETLSQCENIYKLWILSGRHNIVAHANFTDITEFQEFSSGTLHEINGIANYETSIVTNSVINEGGVILEDL